MLEIIDADQLPVHWGGTATDADGDPYCRSQVRMLHCAARVFGVFLLALLLCEMLLTTAILLPSAAQLYNKELS